MKVKVNQLTATDFISLTDSVGWLPLPEEQVKHALARSVATFAAFDDEDNLMGMARLLGDGAFIFYIEDMIVNPKFQNQHVGTAIIEKSIETVKEMKHPDWFVTLDVMSDPEPETISYYEKFGFKQGANGMMMDINQEINGNYVVDAGLDHNPVRLNITLKPEQ